MSIINDLKYQKLEAETLLDEVSDVQSLLEEAEDILSNSPYDNCNIIDAEEDIEKSLVKIKEALKLL